MNFDVLKKTLFNEAKASIPIRLDPNNSLLDEYNVCYTSIENEEFKAEVLNTFKTFAKQDIEKNVGELGTTYRTISDIENNYNEQIIETYVSELQSFISEQLEDISSNSATIKQLKDQEPIKDVVDNVIKAKQETIDDPAVYLTFVDKLELDKTCNEQVKGFIQTSFENRNHELLSKYIHYDTASNEIKPLYDQLFTEEIKETYDEINLLNKDFISVYTKNFSNDFTDEFIKYIFICISKDDSYYSLISNYIEKYNNDLFKILDLYNSKIESQQELENVVDQIKEIELEEETLTKAKEQLIEKLSSTKQLEEIVSKMKELVNVRNEELTKLVDEFYNIKVIDPKKHKPKVNKDVKDPKEKFKKEVEDYILKFKEVVDEHTINFKNVVSEYDKKYTELQQQLDEKKKTINNKPLLEEFEKKYKEEKTLFDKGFKEYTIDYLETIYKQNKEGIEKLLVLIKEYEVHKADPIYMVIVSGRTKEDNAILSKTLENFKEKSRIINIDEKFKELITVKTNIDEPIDKETKSIELLENKRANFMYYNQKKLETIVDSIINKQTIEKHQEIQNSFDEINDWITDNYKEEKPIAELKNICATEIKECYKQKTVKPQEDLEILIEPQEDLAINFETYEKIDNYIKAVKAISIIISIDKFNSKLNSQQNPINNLISAYDDFKSKLFGLDKDLYQNVDELFMIIDQKDYSDDQLSKYMIEQGTYSKIIENYLTSELQIDDLNKANIREIYNKVLFELRLMRIIDYILEINPNEDLLKVEEFRNMIDKLTPLVNESKEEIRMKYNEIIEKYNEISNSYEAVKIKNDDKEKQQMITEIIKLIQKIDEFSTYSKTIVGDERIDELQNYKKELNVINVKLDIIEQLFTELLNQINQYEVSMKEIVQTQNKVMNFVKKEKGINNLMFYKCDKLTEQQHREYITKLSNNFKTYDQGFVETISRCNELSKNYPQDSQINHKTNYNQNIKPLLLKTEEDGTKFKDYEYKTYSDKFDVMKELVNEFNTSFSGEAIQYKTQDEIKNFLNELEKFEKKLVETDFEDVMYACFEEDKKTLLIAIKEIKFEIECLECCRTEIRKYVGNEIEYISENISSIENIENNHDTLKKAFYKISFILYILSLKYNFEKINDLKEAQTIFEKECAENLNQYEKEFVATERINYDNLIKVFEKYNVSLKQIKTVLNNDYEYTIKDILTIELKSQMSYEQIDILIDLIHQSKVIELITQNKELTQKFKQINEISDNNNYEIIKLYNDLASLLKVYFDGDDSEVLENMNRLLSSLYYNANTFNERDDESETRKNFNKKIKSYFTSYENNLFTELEQRYDSLKNYRDIGSKLKKKIEQIENDLKSILNNGITEEKNIFNDLFERINKVNPNKEVLFQSKHEIDLLLTIPKLKKKIEEFEDNPILKFLSSYEDKIKSFINKEDIKRVILNISDFYNKLNDEIKLPDDIISKITENVTDINLYNDMLIYDNLMRDWVWKIIDDKTTTAQSVSKLENLKLYYMSFIEHIKKINFSFPEFPLHIIFIFKNHILNFVKSLNITSSFTGYLLNSKFIAVDIPNQTSQENEDLYKKCLVNKDKAYRMLTYTLNLGNQFLEGQPLTGEEDELSNEKLYDNWHKYIFGLDKPEEDKEIINKSFTGGVFTEEEQKEIEHLKTIYFDYYKNIFTTIAKFDDYFCKKTGYSKNPKKIDKEKTEFLNKLSNQNKDKYISSEAIEAWCNYLKNISLENSIEYNHEGKNRTIIECVKKFNFIRNILKEILKSIIVSLTNEETIEYKAQDPSFSMCLKHKTAGMIVNDNKDKLWSYIINKDDQIVKLVDKYIEDNFREYIELTENINKLNIRNYEEVYVDYNQIIKEIEENISKEEFKLLDFIPDIITSVCKVMYGKFEYELKNLKLVQNYQEYKTGQTSVYTLFKHYSYYIKNVDFNQISQILSNKRNYNQTLIDLFTTLVPEIKDSDINKAILELAIDNKYMFETASLDKSGKYIYPTNLIFDDEKTIWDYQIDLTYESHLYFIINYYKLFTVSAGKHAENFLNDYGKYFITEYENKYDITTNFISNITDNVKSTDQTSLLSFDKSCKYKYRYAFNLIPGLFEDITNKHKHIQPLIDFKRFAVIDFSSNKKMNTIIRIFKEILDVYKDFYTNDMSVYVVENENKYKEIVNFDFNKSDKISYYIYNLIENYNLILSYLKQEIKTNFIDRKDFLDSNYINNHTHEKRIEFLGYIQQLTEIGEKFEKSLTSDENKLIEKIKKSIRKIDTKEDTVKKKYIDLKYIVYLEFLRNYAIKPIFIQRDPTVVYRNKKYTITTSINIDIHTKLYEQLWNYLRQYTIKMKSNEEALLKVLKNSKSTYVNILKKTATITKHYASLTGITNANDAVKTFYEFFKTKKDFDDYLKKSNSVCALALIVENIIGNLSTNQDQKVCQDNIKLCITQNINFILDENIRNNLSNVNNIRTIIETNDGKTNALSLLFKGTNVQAKEVKGGNLNNNIIIIISIIVLIVVIVIVVVLVIKYIKKKEELRNEVVNSN